MPERAEVAGDDATPEKGCSVLEALPEEDESESDWSEDGSDAGDWVTPENFHRFGADAAPEREEDVRVACVTGDYSCQNVLLQMGLHVMTFDGYRVRSVKLWGLLCRGCTHFSRDSQKIFCSKCGGSTVDRVPITVEADGSVTVHDNRRRVRKKGTIYSIPKQQTGRHANNLLLREDELMMGGRDRELRRQKKLYEKERETHSLTGSMETTKGWWHRSTTAAGNLAVAGMPQVFAGYGRKNPNANNFRGRRPRK